MPDPELVRYEVRDGCVAVVALDRPEKMNALTPPLREALAGCFDAAARDAQVRAVLLTAVGPHFCASGDVSRMGDFTPASARELLKLAHRMVRALAGIDKPVVAGVRGAVAGIGWSMALACDAVIASETAKFTQVFRHVGVVPDGGAVFFLAQHLGLLRAKELVYSGRRVDAQEAHALGLVNRVVPDAELDAAAYAHALELARGPTFAFGMAKKMFKLVYPPGLDAFLEAEAWAQGQALMSEDHKEGVQAFFDKRKPRFQGR